MHIFISSDRDATIMTCKALHGKLTLEVLVTTCKDPGNLVNAHDTPRPPKE